MQEKNPAREIQVYLDSSLIVTEDTSAGRVSLMDRSISSARRLLDASN